MNATELEQLSNLISLKGWAVFDGMIRGRKEAVEQVLTEFLDQMTGSQRLLTMELLTDYLILKDYTRPAIELLELICAQSNDSLNVAPVKVKNASKVKSGDALVYEMDANQGVVGDREINFSDDPFQSDFWKMPGSKVLVDDFIGTGDQFIEMLDNMTGCGLTPKVDFLATLVIQQSGREKVEAKGIQVIALHTRPKALEQIATATGRKIEDLHSLYLTIEEKTGCSPFESLGYMASEATVTMKKTPDNTLPIFWHEGDSGWLAPFPRKRK